MDDGTAARDDYSAPTWWESHRHAIASGLFFAFVVAALIAACASTGCSRQAGTAAEAAPAAPNGNADECPGGVCHLPPKRGAK